MSIRRGFKNSSVVEIIAFFVLLIANGLSMFAFSTTSWAYIDNKVFNYQGYGLWRICATTGSCSLLDGTRSEWYMKVQACGIFGMLGINIALLLVISYLFVEWWQKDIELEVAAILCSFAGAVFYGLAVSIYKEEMPNWVGFRTDLEFGNSMTMAKSAAVVSAVGGGLLLYDVIKKRDSLTV
ncbi:hypothetical protein C0Q70_19276 [Pomacea canaliculata]|uniref:Claudin n=1 Tax=Pomacea canaliculata TaxID=400727 RepID=A0A2T7NIW0_POMCA|nr:uncharacterized protein LOC112576433 [Pomacea canaliculata]PVD21110.1 hypothetical protein C0Q70_19276 [Pomacea canaliculata]